MPDVEPEHQIKPNPGLFGGDHSWGPRLAWVAIFLLYLLVRLPLLEVPLDRDEGAFGLVGQAILQGELPFRDIFDHKPPGVFYAYAAALPFIPPTAAGVHAALLIWNLGTLLCLASLAGALAGRRAALWTAFVFAVISTAPSAQGFTASAEMLLLLPLAAGFRLTLTALSCESRHMRRLLLALAGAIGAGACWIKQPAAWA